MCCFSAAEKHRFHLCSHSLQRDLVSKVSTLPTVTIFLRLLGDYPPSPFLRLSSSIRLRITASWPRSTGS